MQTSAIRNALSIIYCLAALCPPAQLHALEVEAMNYPAWLIRDYETRPLLPGARLGANQIVCIESGARQQRSSLVITNQPGRVIHGFDL